MNGGRQNDDYGDETPPRFIADAMLGKLARWLRIFGFDVEYSATSSDEELLERAVGEKRVLLTRDRDLHSRSTPHSHLLQSTGLEEQLRDVIETFGLSYYDLPTRCPHCNTVLEEVRKDELLEIVPKGALDEYNDFYRCPGCGKVYWHGSHWERIVSRARKVGFPNLDSENLDYEV